MWGGGGGGGGGVTVCLCASVCLHGLRMGHSFIDLVIVLG